MLEDITYSITKEAEDIVDLHRRLADGKIKVRQALYLECDTAYRLLDLYRLFYEIWAADTALWGGVSELERVEQDYKTDYLQPVGVAGVVYDYESVRGGKITDTAYVVVMRARSSVYTTSSKVDESSVSALLARRSADAVRLK